MNYRIFGTDCVHEWLKTGVAVVDIGGAEGIDQGVMGYEGICWWRSIAVPSTSSRRHRSAAW